MSDPLTPTSAPPSTPAPGTPLPRCTAKEIIEAVKKRQVGEPGEYVAAWRVTQLEAEQVALTQQRSEQGWQPIETHKGTAEPVLVAEANGGVVEAYYSEEHDTWWEINSCDDGAPGSDRRAYPTHWRPLPAPPADPRQGDE